MDNKTHFYKNKIKKLYGKSACLSRDVPFNYPNTIIHGLIKLNETQRENKGRVIIVGDIHGCFDEFHELLFDKIKINTKIDIVVLVGDLVNKAPKSLEVVQFVKKHYISPFPLYDIENHDITEEEISALKEYGIDVNEGLIDEYPEEDKYIYCIKGNHEDNALNVYKYLTQNETTIENDKDNLMWVNNTTQQERLFLAQLPFSISIPELSLFVVHAGLLPNIDLKEQHLSTLYRCRNMGYFDPSTLVDDDNDGDESESNGNNNDNDEIDNEPFLIAFEREVNGEPWINFWNDENNHCYFGHDAKRKLQQTQFATGLDTGCCYGFHLSCCVIDIETKEREIIQIEAKETYCPIE